MPRKYDEQPKSKAVRLLTEHRDDYSSEYEAIKTVAGRLGMNPETLRKWLRQAEIDTGDRDGVGSGAWRLGPHEAIVSRIDSYHTIVIETSDQAVQALGP